MVFDSDFQKNPRGYTEESGTAVLFAFWARGWHWVSVSWGEFSRPGLRGHNTEENDCTLLGLCLCLGLSSGVQFLGILSLKAPEDWSWMITFAELWGTAEKYHLHREEGPELLTWAESQILTPFWFLLCQVFRCEKEKRFNRRQSLLSRQKPCYPHLVSLLQILAEPSNSPASPQMLLWGCRYHIVQKASCLSINQSYKTWSWWIPDFHWVPIYALAEAGLRVLGSGSISKNYVLNFIRNKSGDEVKNKELLAFGRDHFGHQVCHQVFLEYAQNFENVMSVVTKSQLLFSFKRAVTRFVFGLCNSL